VPRFRGTATVISNARLTRRPNPHGLEGSTRDLGQRLAHRLSRNADEARER